MSTTTITVTMTTSTLIYSLLYLVISSNGLKTSNSDRRILHQPFFPLESSSSPPSPPQHSFFPSYPSPPQPEQPPPSSSSSSVPASPFASFPANISSLILPHSPSPKPVSKKLIAVTVSLSLTAALIAAVALIFYFHGRRRRRGGSDGGVEGKATTPTHPPVAHLPKVRNSGTNNSSEFLYLGTLVNSSGHSGNVGAGGGGREKRNRKMDSPELHPLSPFPAVQRQQQAQSEVQTRVDEDQDEFYSPRGSVSGRESGSESKRVFTAVVIESKVGGKCDRSFTLSSSSSSESDSPSRSASISISPSVTVSPKNRSSISNPKSSPEFIELKIQSQAPPASPPLPEMTFSPPYSPSSSGTEKEMRTIKEEDEAEELPLLSNGSCSSRMTSPPESPILSPMFSKLGKSSPAEERKWKSISRNAPSPASPSLSDSSTPRRKSFSSLKLPTFLVGGKRKSSLENSPQSPPSPISSSDSSSRKTRSYPASPLSNISDRKRRSDWGFTSTTTPPPPPPPPPPALRRSHSPPPQPKPISEPAGVPMSVRSVVAKKPEVESPMDCSRSTEIEELTAKPKLKPLHWDKVRASSDRKMVWDQFRSSSFKLNEEMIETLFVVNKPNPSKKETPQNHVQQCQKQENRVLDPKKAQNIAILLRALNVTTEEVCEALMEGNAETLGTEVLESLLKMAPSKEEERKLMEYKDDSPVKLAHAEKFLKAVIDIPFAFKRIEAMLYIANFESEIEYLKKSFDTLEVACDELRNSRMFLKLLEAVLKTGNRMNVGTNRGQAQAFKLDTLLKLADIKGTDGKTTLLHFVVHEIIKIEGLQIVSSLSSELNNVKKAAAMDSDVLTNDVIKLTSGLELIDQTRLKTSDSKFSESMIKFMKTAEEDIFRVQAQERVAFSLVKEITEYFHGNSAKEEAHPLRIFMVVRDFLTVLDRVCKEVGMINERTTVSSAHRFPVPVNPMLPVPVNPFHPQVMSGFPGQRMSSFSDDGSL